MTLIRPLLLIAALLTSASAHAQSCVQVEVQNLRPEQGALMVAAYTDAADFNKKPATALQMRAGASPTSSFQLCGLSGPLVALALFQDLNSNGKLDTSVLGIPTEPWGASGKPPGFSAPTWESSQIPLNGSPIVVKLSQ